MAPNAAALPVVTGLVVGIGFVVLFSLSIPSYSVMEVVNSISNTVSPEDSLREGRDVIIVSTDAKQVNATRGSTVTVPLTITYKESPSNTSEATTVTLAYDGISGTLYVGKDHLLINRNAVVVVNPSSVTLSPSESITAEMQIVIPHDWHEETIGQSIMFSPTFKITEQDDSSNIAIFNTASTVNLIK